MAKFREMLAEQSNKDQNKQKLIKRNLKMNSYEQVVSEEGNIIYIVPNNGDSIVYRYRLTEQWIKSKGKWTIFLTSGVNISSF